MRRRVPAALGGENEEMMKKLTTALLVLVPVGLLVWAIVLMVSAPASPPFEVRLKNPDLFEALKAIVDQAYLKAAYVIVWAIQIGYLAWLALKWRAQRLVGRGPAGRRSNVS